MYDCAVSPLCHLVAVLSVVLFVLRCFDLCCFALSGFVLCCFVLSFTCVV